MFAQNTLSFNFYFLTPEFNLQQLGPCRSVQHLHKAVCHLNSTILETVHVARPPKHAQEQATAIDCSHKSVETASCISQVSHHVSDSNIAPLILPRSHSKANCMALPPAPQKASTMTSHRHRSAMCCAILSGVTENQLSEKQAQSVKTTIVQSLMNGMKTII